MQCSNAGTVPKTCTQCGIIYTFLLPPINDSRNSTIKIKNSILAIPAALAAIPPKPNTAAIIAITRKVTVQRNIVVSFKMNNDYG